MIDSEFPPPHSQAGRRLIATTDHRLRRRCPLADATGIGFAIARRQASTRRATATTVYSDQPSRVQRP
jgi:hypothetical protein